MNKILIFFRPGTAAKLTSATELSAAEDLVFFFSLIDFGLCI